MDVPEPAAVCALHGAPPAEAGRNSRGETWVVYFCECRATVLRDLRDPDAVDADA